MVRKYVLPILAVAGVIFAIFMVRASNKPPKVAPPVAEPAKPPFQRYVAGSGIIEAATENIAIGTPVAGLVTEVYARVGNPIKAGLPHEIVRRIAPMITTGRADEQFDDMIVPAPLTQPATRAADLASGSSAETTTKLNVNTASREQLAGLPGVGEPHADVIIAGRPYLSIWDLEGTPLFKIDDRQARSDLAVRKAAAEQARQRLAKALEGTRPEDLLVAVAQLDEAKAAYETARRNYVRWSSVEDASAVAPEELANRKSAMDETAAKVRNMEANLKKLEAGTWQPDVAIARAELAAAEAEVRLAQTEIDRLTVRAPVNGSVLQVKVRPGEYAPSGVLETPLMLVGRTDVLHIRVDVDEHEAMRVRPDADAVASIRGDSKRQAKLRFVRIEPYVVPKKSLTGDSSERVDTRVLQIVYAFDPSELKAYVGQQMDVFIDAVKADEDRGATQPATTRGAS